MKQPPLHTLLGEIHAYKSPTTNSYPHSLLSLPKSYSQHNVMFLNFMKGTAFHLPGLGHSLSLKIYCAFVI